MEHDWDVLNELSTYTSRLSGSVSRVQIPATRLVGNPLGDAVSRPCLIYLPRTTRPLEQLPHLYLLHGSATSVTSWLTIGALPVIDSWITEHSAPTVVVMPDAWTSTGGSQYLDSPAVGHYLSYLIHDVIATIDALLPADKVRTRGVMGHASGGLGAYNLCVSEPDTFSSLAMLAPDALFESTYLASVNDAQRSLALTYSGDWERFACDLPTTPSKSLDPALVQHWTLAHAYAATPRPMPVVHPKTGELDLHLWPAWLRHHPVRRARNDRRALTKLNTVYLSGAVHDPTYSDLGAAALARKLRAAGCHPRLDRLEADRAVTEHLPNALAHLLSPASASRTGPR